MIEVVKYIKEMQVILIYNVGKLQEEIKYS